MSKSVPEFGVSGTPLATFSDPAVHRVLHITYRLDFGGVESGLCATARARGRRHDYHFCALEKGGASAGVIRSAGAGVTVFNIDPWKAPLRSLFSLVALIRRLRPTVVHSHGLEGNLFGIPAALFSRTPLRIAEEIGIPEHSTKMKAALRVVYAMAHRIVAVSDAVRDAIIEEGEASARKVVRIYNPVELPPRRAAQQMRGEALRIAFVGRLHAAKNPLSLVEALTLLPEGLPVELLIVGEGSERDAIEQFVRSRNLSHKVRLTGFQPNPHDEIAKCHLYVQPSHSEGFGIALVEAMGCGLPVIATSRGGMAEIVDHGVNGWLIESGEPRQIAEAILRAAHLGPAKLAKIGMAARRSVEDRFRPDRYVQEIEALYDKCLRR